MGYLAILNPTYNQCSRCNLKKEVTRKFKPIYHVKIKTAISFFGILKRKNSELNLRGGVKFDLPERS